jgi:hypothetical protein
MEVIDAGQAVCPDRWRAPEGYVVAAVCCRRSIELLALATAVGAAGRPAQFWVVPHPWQTYRDPGRSRSSGLRRLTHMPNRVHRGSAQFGSSRSYSSGSSPARNGHGLPLAGFTAER